MEGQPQHRVEPVDDLQERHDPVQRQVVLLQVRELMQKDMAQLLARKLAHHSLRQHKTQIK